MKTGAYGLVRFVVPLFPSASSQLAPMAMGLAVIGIVYGALLAFAQTDLKRMVAYTSVSHMGFVLLGVYAWNSMALQGVVLQLICHGIGTGALFLIVGALQERIHTRDIRQMGGLWSTMPRMAASALLFALATLALPGLGNFVGEFLVLIGTFQVNALATILATFGLVASTIYSLWLMQRVFYGQHDKVIKIPDFSFREMLAIGTMVVLILWLGLYPQPVLDTARQTLEHLQPAISFAYSQKDLGSSYRQRKYQEVVYDGFQPDHFIAIPNPRLDANRQPDFGYIPEPPEEDRGSGIGRVGFRIPFSPS